MFPEQNRYVVARDPREPDAVKVAELAGELSADDLEEVVGGLERTWVIPSPPENHAMF